MAASIGACCCEHRTGRDTRANASYEAPAVDEQLKLATYVLVQDKQLTTDRVTGSSVEERFLMSLSKITSLI